MPGWWSLLARTPLLVAPAMVVGFAGAASFVGVYRGSKWTTAKVLFVKPEQQAACQLYGAAGTIPLAVSFLVYRELKHKPPSISDTLAARIGASSYLSVSGLRAMRDAIAPALRFQATNLFATAVLAGVGHSLAIRLFCKEQSLQKYRAQQAAAAATHSAHGSGAASAKAAPAAAKAAAVAAPVAAPASAPAAAAAPRPPVESTILLHDRAASAVSHAPTTAAAPTDRAE